MASLSQVDPAAAIDTWDRGRSPARSPVHTVGARSPRHGAISPRSAPRVSPRSRGSGHALHDAVHGQVAASPPRLTLAGLRDHARRAVAVRRQFAHADGTEVHDAGGGGARGRRRSMGGGGRRASRVGSQGTSPRSRSPRRPSRTAGLSFAAAAMVVKVDTNTRTHPDDKAGAVVEDERGSKWAPDAGSGSGAGQPFDGGSFPDMASYSRFCHTLQQPGWTRTEADTQLIADGLARCVTKQGGWCVVGVAGA